MKPKKIDNEIKASRERINALDSRLNLEKSKLKKIDEMQESLYELNKNMSKCIELLSKSIVGPTTNRFFNDMENNNRAFYLKSNNLLEEETNDTMRNINKLYKEKVAEIEKGKQKEEEKE